MVKVDGTSAPRAIHQSIEKFVGHLTQNSKGADKENFFKNQELLKLLN